MSNAYNNAKYDEKQIVEAECHRCVSREDMETVHAPEGKGGWPGSWKWAGCQTCNGFFKVDGFCMEPNKCRGGTCQREYACNH